MFFLKMWTLHGSVVFDPQLVLLGPIAYVILDNSGQLGYIVYAILYPIALGTACAGLGFILSSSPDRVGRLA